MAHTAGLWKAMKINGVVGVASAASGYSDDILIAECRQAGFSWDTPMAFGDDAETEKLDNARLMATAPELVKCLRTLMDTCCPAEWKQKWPDIAEQCRHVLFLAGGSDSVAAGKSVNRSELSRVP